MHRRSRLVGGCAAALTLAAVPTALGAGPNQGDPSKVEYFDGEA